MHKANAHGNYSKEIPVMYSNLRISSLEKEKQKNTQQNSDPPRLNTLET